MSEGYLIRITAPHFVAGVIVSGEGRVLRAAPILAWSHRAGAEALAAWCRRRGFVVEVLG